MQSLISHLFMSIKRAIAVSALIGPVLLAQPGAPQLPDRLAIRRQVEQGFPLPLEPRAPVRPSAPGKVGSMLAGILVGGGAFVGSATLCGKTTLVGEAPLGSVLDGRYVAPGESVPVAANAACTAGIGAGAALVSGWLTKRARAGGYVRALARYEAEVAGFPAARAAWERTVAQRNAAVDSAVGVAVAAAEWEAARQREQRRQQFVADSLRAVAAAPAAPVTPPVAPASAVATAIPVPRTGLVNPDAVAVVIGNAKYTRSEVPAVDFAGRDAEAMKQFLVETFGFREENIIVERDATFTTLQRIFGTAGDFKGQLYNYMRPNRPTDVFVFYSGHGAPDPGTGTAYLVPSDADPQAIRLTGYPVRQLYANLAQLEARSLTVVMDACFSGLADRGSLVRGISPITLRVENPVLAASNSLVLTAAQSTEVSGWYDAQQHGLFTYVLLNTLSQTFRNGVPAAMPTARQLNEQVSDEVLRLSRRLRQRDQNPMVAGSAADAPLPFIRVP